MAVYKGYNYGYNREHMEDEFSSMAEVCRAAKMSEEKIEKIHRLLLDELNDDRRFYTHTISYDGLKFPDGEWSSIDNNPLMETYLDQFASVSVEISNCDSISWTECLDSNEIIAWVKTLNETDFQLITLLVVDGLKQTEIAELWGVTASMISKRKKRLEKELLQILPEWLKKRYTG